VIHHVEFLRSKKDLWKVKGVAKVNEEVVMEAILLAVLLPAPPMEEV
jgi:3-hydroxymyristoyl/3-hydroxydecanoyl-(acyl carrier protein) dehydratase